MNRRDMPFLDSIQCAIGIRSECQLFGSSQLADARIWAEEVSADHLVCDLYCQGRQR
jgi:hypothetical protein